MAGMNRREVGFLIIGVGLGLLLFLALTVEVMMSLRDGSTLTGYYISRVAFLIPVALLALGVILVVYRNKDDQISK